MSRCEPHPNQSGLPHPPTPRGALSLQILVLPTGGGSELLCSHPVGNLEGHFAGEATSFQIHLCLKKTRNLSCGHTLKGSKGEKKQTLPAEPDFTEAKNHQLVCPFLCLLSELLTSSELPAPCPRLPDTCLHAHRPRVAQPGLHSVQSIQIPIHRIAGTGYNWLTLPPRLIWGWTSRGISGNFH